MSFKTVSRVVNNEDGVSHDLTIRVKAAIADLGYRPDDRARRLRTGASRNGVIGFILVDVANPFFSMVLRGIEEVARKHDYLVISGSTDGDHDRQDQLVSSFVSRRVDGMIVVPSGNELGALATELQRGTPTVFVDLGFNGVNVDLLRSDHEGGTRLATEHLLNHGHTDIAFFGSHRDIFSAQLRLSGFLSAMHDAGIEVPAHRIANGQHTPEDWQQIITDHLTDHPRPTAIITAQNLISIGGMQALHSLGLRDTIAHIGFDDVELAAIVTPGLSVVPQSPLELGRRSATLLFDRLDGNISPPHEEILPCSIIQRGSGEIRPANSAAQLTQD